jgi:carboxymethylenebutenolidase
MAETIVFPSDGGQANGYLAQPPGSSGPGVVLVQEWWGLDPSLLEVADRIAAAGFVVLVPDLYHGEICDHADTDRAAQLMTALPPDRAARDLRSAVDHLVGRPGVTGDRVGIVGFCMGGMLAWILAAERGDRVGAVVPFYGYPSGPSTPDWERLTAPVRAHLAEHDEFFPPQGGQALAEELRARGKDVVVTVHAGTGHAFMNPHDSIGNLDAELAARLWPEVFDFLHAELG